ncbi:hypothetical protein [uncultured Paraglaciecola sp.]|uniref:hypothetical protein n=1 Tax=uncultured Paraglaciecola sp. TaxID=1765024 RepID=UPI0030DA0516|tara:strand:- start:101089 stop:101757 length:669 start_codon:yes stop_codon:yes gene_type:complete
MIRISSILITILCLLLGSYSLKSQATLIGGVDFPQGEVSFADSVHSFTPNISGGEPGDIFLGADNALGIPDFAGESCLTQADCTFVSLGSGGSIVLQFVDNLLTGSDSSALDLWIFEIGGDIEDTFVDISVDAVNWLSVGAVGGSTSGIDIDSFGFDSSFVFSYVRLTDDSSKDAQSGTTVGADIDAVGAITTVRAVDVPSPSVTGLLIVTVLLLLGMRKRI